jgi:hypothetical protein
MSDEVVVRIERREPDGTFDCRAYSGVPCAGRCLVTIVAADSSGASQNAKMLQDEIEKDLLSLSPKCRLASMGHSAPASTPGTAIQNDPVWRKALLLVGANGAAVVVDNLLRQWLGPDKRARDVLPVYPRTAQHGIGSLIGTDFSAANAEFWDESLKEAVPAVFSVAGITYKDPRIFISYRRTDSLALANQLFDALSHMRFDVFLDHYRVPPGGDFQARLSQELGDKSMLLLLESATFRDSEWTMYEVQTAKTCGLSIFALQVPGGEDIPGVDMLARRLLDAALFGGTFDLNSALKQVDLEDIVRDVRHRHDQGLAYRRDLLQQSIEDALTLAGVQNFYWDPAGILHVKSPNSGAPEYLIWFTTRPPEIEDFYRTHVAGRPDTKGVVIGLSRLMQADRAETFDWLAGLAKIVTVDEGKIKQAATKIAAGTL